MTDGRLQRIATLVEWKQDVPAERDDDRLVVDGEAGLTWLPRPCRQINEEGPPLSLGDGLAVDPAASGERLQALVTVPHRATDRLRYREALDRYAGLRGASDLSFMDERLPLREAVRLLLDGTARGLVDPRGEIGCMLNTGMIASHPDHADLAREFAARRAAFRELLAGKLRAWVPEPRANRLARYIVAVMQGLPIQARDGYDLDELRAVAAEALATVPGEADGLEERTHAARSRSASPASRLG